MGPPSPSSSQLRILVADDEPHIRRVLSTLLTREGYLVDEAKDGAAAIELWRSGPHYDAALIDLMMPGATGLEVLDEIRKGEHGVLTPVIILTAKGHHADRDEAFAAGAHDFMTKPFSPKKLVARLHEVLHDR